MLSLTVSYQVKRQWKCLLSNYRQNETDQVQFLNILSDKLYKDNADECSFILGSDFNVVRDKNLDYMGQSSLKKQSKVSIELKDFMNRFRMIDIWRKT